MRKIIGAVFVSLDGVIQAPGPGRGPERRVRSWAAGCPILRRGRRRGIDKPVHPALRPSARPAHLRHLRRLLALQGGRSGRHRRAVRPRRQICADPQRPEPRLAEQPPARKRRRARRAEARRGPRPDHPGQRHPLPAIAAAGLIDRLILMTFPVVLARASACSATDTAPGAMRMVEHRSPRAATSSPPTNRPARSSPAASRPRSPAPPSWSAAGRSRKAPGERPCLPQAPLP